MYKPVWSTACLQTCLPDLSACLPVFHPSALAFVPYEASLTIHLLAPIWSPTANRLDHLNQESIDISLSSVFNNSGASKSRARLPVISRRYLPVLGRTSHYPSRLPAYYRRHLLTSSVTWRQQSALESSMLSEPERLFSERLIRSSTFHGVLSRRC